MRKSGAHQAQVNGAIRWPRVRRVVRLLGELREMGTGEAAREHLVKSLMVELGAQAGIIVRDEAMQPGGPKNIAGGTLAGFDSGSIDAVKVCEEKGRDFNPCLNEMLGRFSPDGSDGLIVHMRDDLIPRAWQCSDYVNEHLRPARLNRFIATARVLGPHTCEGIAFWRQAGDRPFTDEDCDVMRLIQLEAPPLFQPRAIALAPREEQTLAHLVTGASDKEIAARLDLSIHTVREYVTAIFRAFGVQTRSQLVANLGGRVPDLGGWQRPWGGAESRRGRARAAVRPERSR